ncbi:hypothetical protein DL93DRAFT_836174 [Clavulina sp. PMI_390]|nr:hypothetical protein DL93DRAFT_836174 [Clavulina sp. PMI_390]
MVCAKFCHVVMKTKNTIPDDFDDFQSAPAVSRPDTSQTLGAANPSTTANVFDMLGSTTTATTNTTLHNPSAATAPLAWGGSSIQPTPVTRVTQTVSPATLRAAPTPTQSSTSTFDDLWDLGLGSETSAKPMQPAAGTKSIKDLEREKAQAGMWNSSSTTTSSTTRSGGIDDLLF